MTTELGCNVVDAPEPIHGNTGVAEFVVTDGDGPAAVVEMEAVLAVSGEVNETVGLEPGVLI